MSIRALEHDVPRSSLTPVTIDSQMTFCLPKYQRGDEMARTRHGNEVWMTFLTELSNCR